MSDLRSIEDMFEQALREMPAGQKFGSAAKAPAKKATKVAKKAAAPKAPKAVKQSVGAVSAGIRESRRAAKAESSAHLKHDPTNLWKPGKDAPVKSIDPVNYMRQNQTAGHRQSTDPTTRGMKADSQTYKVEKTRGFSGAKTGRGGLSAKAQTSRRAQAAAGEARALTTGERFKPAGAAPGGADKWRDGMQASRSDRLNLRTAAAKPFPLPQHPSSSAAPRATITVGESREGMREVLASQSAESRRAMDGGQRLQAAAQRNRARASAAPATAPTPPAASTAVPAAKTARRSPQRSPQPSGATTGPAVTKSVPAKKAAAKKTSTRRTAPANRTPQMADVGAIARSTATGASSPPRARAADRTPAPSSWGNTRERLTGVEARAGQDITPSSRMRQPPRVAPKGGRLGVAFTAGTATGVVLNDAARRRRENK